MAACRNHPRGPRRSAAGVVPPDSQPTRIRIERIWPQLDCGRYPVKRPLGERVDVWATLLRDGHEVLGGALRYRPPGGAPLARDAVAADPARTSTAGTDRSSSTGSGAGSSEWSRWVDRVASWKRELERKVAAGQSDLASELSEGAALLGVPELSVAQGLAAEAGDRSEPALADETLEIAVDSERATFGSWYELFPRSWGGFAGVEKVLPELAQLGFDVLYLPPVHPIGKTHRKGRNNAPSARRADPGSPWAIGSEAGGHTALHPELGGEREFASLTARAAELGIAIALDFAIQCSPDHPWLREHPDWFHRRPDGTLKYAENPPKRYQDIYNVNFDTRGLAGALERAARRRAALGRPGRDRVPRRQPAHQAGAFWEWLIADVQRAHPETVFLAEAFTRPAMMALLAKAGFSQSYTYFTWRNTKAELTEYLTAAHAVRAAAVLPAQLLRQHARHPPCLPRPGRAPGIRGAPRPGRHALPELRPLLGLRALRERAAERGQRGVPELREVRAQEAHARRAAPAADRAPQRRPAREPRAAAARQPDLPGDRERAPDRLRQAHGATTR